MTTKVDHNGRSFVAAQQTIEPAQRIEPGGFVHVGVDLLRKPGCLAGRLRGDDGPGIGEQMKPFSMRRRVAAVLAVAALAPALTAWSPAARPAARVLSCARLPITPDPATGGHQPPWDMPPVVDGLFEDIAARSSSSAVAVGGDLHGGLVARWNGTAWKTLNSPAVAGASFLYGVAVFDGGAWAVGQQDMSGAPLVGIPLLVRVTGTTVRQVPVPRTPDGADGLQAVAATSATDAWAVGWIGVHGSLIWHWNGAAWKNVRLPAAVARVVGPVGGVAATSRTNVWLVSRGRIVHWNGRWWTVISPNIGIGRRYDLTGVAATSARNVFATGRTNPGQRALMLHWNGRQWTCTLTPRISAQLFAVSTSSPDNAWAVGNNDWPAGGPDDALALHWNGHTWKQVFTAQPGGSDTDLQGVGLVPRSDRAWAVGFINGDIDGTLMMHWNGTAWK